MNAKLLSGAEIVFKSLEDQKVEYIFGYLVRVLPIYDELKDHKSIKHILARHEQGAGHAAEGYARSSGKPGVLLVTSGPGATNAVTALTVHTWIHSCGLYLRTSSDTFNRNGCVSRV